MSELTARFLVQRLRDWDVGHLFGCEGTGPGPVAAAISAAGDPIRYVSCADEEFAMMQAVGYAKFSGKPGVCLADGFSGAVRLLNGLYDAALDRVPAVAVVDARGGRRAGTDLRGLFREAVGDRTYLAATPDELPGQLDRALRGALADGRPAALLLPDARPSAPAAGRRDPPRPRLGAVGFTPPVSTAIEREVSRAADIIDSGDRVVLMVGPGAADAAAEVRELAEITRAGIAKVPLGKDVLADDLPYVTGTLTADIDGPCNELLRDCDTLVIIGSGPAATPVVPWSGRRAVQIDRDAAGMGTPYPTEVNLVGDARSTLRALLWRLDGSSRRPGRHRWRRRVEAEAARWWRSVDGHPPYPAGLEAPMRVCQELSVRLPDNAVVTAEPGLAGTGYTQVLRFGSGMRGSLSSSLAAVGTGLPYALGAKFAAPDRPVIALADEKAMRANGLAGLLAISGHHRRWDDPRLVLCLLGEGDGGAGEGDGGAGEPAGGGSPSPVDFAALARSVGIEGITVTGADDLGAAWDRALAARRPVLLDARGTGAAARPRRRTASRGGSVSA
ncbi:thiamine pyrophosphate-binding protein [Allonocardiopsis opalescens]|uniref:Pyruvate dehydrogenase (Quinone) n=1 Tax=Allonocardiopsis opalescens TaxID=1144618 RepID=A0A2T0PXC7_9ACTN|nr:thiamine pyrophosphate-binding protein [Allonocardiopsis opalescens]PRX96185.1 pyruvate dehydrogenase (quinone) [Allonocardiopsis opalescens]